MGGRLSRRGDLFPRIGGPGGPPDGGTVNRKSYDIGVLVFSQEYDVLVC